MIKYQARVLGDTPRRRVDALWRLSDRTRYGAREAFDRAELGGADRGEGQDAAFGATAAGADGG